MQISFGLAKRSLQNFAHATTAVGEFIGHRWIPLIKASLGVFSALRLNKHLSKQSWDWWFETPLHSLWRLCNVQAAPVETLLAILTNCCNRDPRIRTYPPWQRMNPSTFLHSTCNIYTPESCTMSQWEYNDGTGPCPTDCAAAGYRRHVSPNRTDTTTKSLLSIIMLFITTYTSKLRIQHMKSMMSFTIHRAPGTWGTLLVTRTLPFLQHQVKIAPRAACDKSLWNRAWPCTRLEAHHKELHRLTCYTYLINTEAYLMPQRHF